MLCPKCGVSNPEGNKFCQSCGASLAALSDSPSVAPKQEQAPVDLLDDVLVPRIPPSPASPPIPPPLVSEAAPPPLPASMPTEVANPGDTSPRKSPFLLLILLLVIVAAVGGGIYYFLNKNILIKSVETIKQVNPIKTPRDEMELAINKVMGAKTAYIDYKMKVTSRITNTKTGITQTFNPIAEGYLAGSTDGKVLRMEIRISSSNNPTASIDISVITTEGDIVYVKGPATQGKWMKLAKAEFEKQAESSPTDASLYGFNLLGTILSENKALFKSIRKDAIEKTANQTVDGKVLNKYTVEIGTPEFIDALEQDKETTQKDKSDAKVILKDAVVRADFFVDPGSNYITKLVIDTKNLAQISTPESEQLGISTVHNIELEANLSRFDVPTGITAPDPKDILNSSTST